MLTCSRPLWWCRKMTQIVIVQILMTVYQSSADSRWSLCFTHFFISAAVAQNQCLMVLWTNCVSALHKLNLSLSRLVSLTLSIMSSNRCSVLVNHKNSVAVKTEQLCPVLSTL